jgi:hypothetical protein
MDHLQRGTEFNCAGGYLAGARGHAGCFHGEKRAEPFATCEDGVTHGTVDGVRRSIGAGKQALKGGIGKFNAGLEQVLYGEGHLNADDKSVRAKFRLRECRFMVCAQ